MRAGVADEVKVTSRSYRPEAQAFVESIRSTLAGNRKALAERTGAPVWLAPGALGSPVPAAAVAHWTGTGDEVATDAGTLAAVPTPGAARP